ncbi:hypothetical protein BaRGS_00005580 [Batillaria attramentaria]|uniref:Ig-like domain-containing protein n=1 Tax=Batillaria attramentaria TaxID=370345 RepID=A0ABD0LUH8_9CAEN
MGSSMWVVLAVTTFLLYGSPPVSGTSPPLSGCVRPFQYQHYILMCHISSAKSYKCPVSWQGFVVEPLFAGSQSTHQDCQFTNLDLLDVDCAKNITHMDEVYDEIIFDIVDAVSGQNEISNIVVPRLPLQLPEPSALDTAVAGATSPSSSLQSSFIAFKKTCKPVMPDEENDFKVINFCSNRTVNDSRVYLTLKGTNQDTLPQENSYCQCTISGIKPTSQISVRALDIRLQNYTSHVCGSTEIQMKWEDKSGSIKCHGKSAMFGSKDVLKSKGNVTLTLSSVSADAFPTALWVEAVAGMMSLPVIIGIAVGGVVFIIIVILVVCGIVRHKRGQNFLPAVCSCPCRSRGADGKPYKHKKVPLHAVYSEPHNPRPSNSAFEFPETPDLNFGDVENVYAEPENGTRINTFRPGPATTPPPLPELPPPSSPPPGVTGNTDTLTGPPKPLRTWERNAKVTTQPTEDYDHIEAGSKAKLKPASTRDRQNNIIGDDSGESSKAPNTYSHLQFGGDYSQTGSVHKKKASVKDNEYDTTA